MPRECFFSVPSPFPSCHVSHWTLEEKLATAAEQHEKMNQRNHIVAMMMSGKFCSAAIICEKTSNHGWHRCASQMGPGSPLYQSRRPA